MNSDLQSQSQLFNSFQPVSVFFRNCRKQARFVTVRTPAQTEDLMAVAGARFNLPTHRIMLFYNGFRIDNYKLPIPLTDRSILHVIDQRNLDLPHLTLHFRPLFQPAIPFKLSLPSDAPLRSFIRATLAPALKMEQDSFFLVYVGKTLNPSNTPREQLLQDGAQIGVVLRRPAEKRYTNEAFEFSSSYRAGEGAGRSEVVDCPVTYLTSLEALKKKHMQQMAMLQLSGIAPAAPKPSPSYPNPLHFDSFQSNPFPSSHGSSSDCNPEAENQKKSSLLEERSPLLKDELKWEKEWKPLLLQTSNSGKEGLKESAAAGNAVLHPQWEGQIQAAP